MVVKCVKCGNDKLVHIEAHTYTEDDPVHGRMEVNEYDCPVCGEVTVAFQSTLSLQECEALAKRREQKEEYFRWDGDVGQDYEFGS